MKKLHKNTDSCKRIHKTSFVVLIAAVIVMMLSLTAYAIYRYSLHDLEAGKWAQTEIGSTGETENNTPLSLVGYQDSPEYKAGDEWEAYIHEKYAAGEYNIEDNPNFPTIWLDLGAYNEEMVAKLEEIAGHYGLTLPDSDQSVADVSSLYATVGTSAFLPAERRTVIISGTARCITPVVFAA